LKERFEDTVSRFADRPALILPDLSIYSYKEMNARANRLTYFLKEQNLRKGDRIGIALEKSWLTYALMMACWKTGIIYFMIDPRNPKSRIENIIDQCQPGLVFLEKQTQQELNLKENFVIIADPDALDLTKFSELNPNNNDQLTGADPAYIMFTSGSTGSPKGAIISHGNLLNFISWSKDQYQFDENDRFTNVNPIYFDNSVFDVYSSLFWGASLVIFPHGILQSPKAIAELIYLSKATIYFSVPSMLIYLMTMKVASPETLGSLENIIFGGEGFPKPKLAQLMKLLGTQVKYHNVYGPTECTCICSSYQVMPEDLADTSGFAPLGSMAKNFSYSILDSDQKAVSVGEIGELYLMGPCLGLGYFNQPQETEKAFVKNPLKTEFTERAYRTGDLIYLSPKDGKIYFAGRKDTQVKHMGYRIELDEVQSGLLKIAQINETIVFQKKKDDFSQIIAVISLLKPMTVAEIKMAAALHLPKYMIPDKFIILESLPKNANGKLDRKSVVTKFSEN
jgi:D-alanine--poly(phosphoribitol) ligase subunit 1